MNAIEKIEAQQEKLDPNTPAWMIGEQLKDICRGDMHCEKIVREDLDSEAMSLQKAADKLQQYANANHGNKKCFCITPKVADGILREFYGLPAAGEPVKEAPVSDFVDLSAFI